MVSTPLSLSSSALVTKPGRCFAEQVGVKAPGRANSTAFLPLKISSVEGVCMPSLSMVFTRDRGNLVADLDGHDCVLSQF